MAKTSFTLDDDLDHWIESRLAYGQSKASFLRHSLQISKDVEPMLDEIYDRHQYEERRDFVMQAVSEKVEERKKEIDQMK